MLWVNLSALAASVFVYFKIEEHFRANLIVMPSWPFGIIAGIFIISLVHFIRSSWFILKKGDAS